MEIGLNATLDFIVTDADTAQSLLSGDLAVLGTPRLVAWLEAVTCAAVHETLASGQTTVGTRVAVEHLAASPVGAAVTATATLEEVDGPRLTFAVVATDTASGKVLGRGEITRAVVDRERFLASASS